jgi:hypothetical protein
VASLRLGLLAAVALVAVLSACTSDPAPAAPKTSAADARANLTILPADGLPDRWARVPAKDRLDGPPGTATYCGVVAEPDPVREGRISYYEEKSLPRAVLEYGMLSTTEGATATLDALTAVRDTCEEPGTTVAPVDVAVGDQSVAWDFTRDDGSAYRVVVFRRTDTVVVLVAFGGTSAPADEQLEIARSIDERLSRDG